MLYPILTSLVIITASAYRSLNIACAQRDVLELCVGREVVIAGTVLERRDKSVTIAIDQIDCGKNISLENPIQAKIYTEITGVQPGDSIAGTIVCNIHQSHSGLLYGRSLPQQLVTKERSPSTLITYLEARSAQMRSQIISTFEKILSPPTYVLVSSLLFGTSYNALSGRSSASNWGILHLLARSGLHLVILMWLLRRCLVLLPISSAIAHGIEWSVLALYTIVTWVSFSYLRALCMGIIGALFSICDRRMHSYGVWWYGCGLVLAMYPLALFAIDFQLSALATLALLIESRSSRRAIP